MAKEYTKEELWKIYESLPKELKQAVFSVETADNIYKTCTDNNLEKDKNSKIAQLVGDVLLGILNFEEIEDALKKELFLDELKAKKIVQEIDRLIFSPLKTELKVIRENKNNLEEAEGVNDTLKQTEELENSSEEKEGDNEEEEIKGSFLEEETMKIREKYRKKPEIKDDPPKEKTRKKLKIEIKKERSRKSSKDDTYRESIE